MTRPVLIIGGGGHARVLIDALRLRSVEIKGVLDADPRLRQTKVAGVPVLGDDSSLPSYSKDEVHLVNAVGSVRVPTQRRKVYDRFKELGFVFATIIHPSAVIAADVIIEEGAQIMAGAVIQTGSRIGTNTIINTSASIDHDCLIGRHVHVAPGVTLSGGTSIDDETHIGAGAVIIQGKRVGTGSLVGAGAIVTSDIPDNVTAFGVPAKVVAP